MLTSVRKVSSGLNTQLSAVVSTHNCQQWSQHTTVISGLNTQLSALDSTHNCITKPMTN